jgi:hypothetical protein
MKGISDISLSECVQQATSEQLEDKRRDVIYFVKQKLQTRDSLQRDVEALEKQLQAKQQQLAKAEEEVAKLAAGDWSVVQLAVSKKNNEEG